MGVGLNGIVFLDARKPIILAFDGLDDATNDFRERFKYDFGLHHLVAFGQWF